MSLLDKFKNLDNPKEIKKEKLHPPMAPKKVKSAILIEKSIETGDINIDYEWIARNSTFQTLWVEIMKHHLPNQFKGVNTRTTGKKMANQFNKKLKEANEKLDFVEELKQGKTGDYKLVISELKLKLAKQKIKIGDNN